MLHMVFQVLQSAAVVCVDASKQDIPALAGLCLGKVNPLQQEEQQ
jgi:hypothetical protein